MGEETTATTTETVVASSTVPAGLDALRDHLRATHQDAVAELITGDSIESLIGSVDTAKSAYQRIATKVGESGSREVGKSEPAATTATPPPAVPAGGAANVVDPANLSPAAKIAQGLKARQAG